MVGIALRCCLLVALLWSCEGAPRDYASVDSLESTAAAPTATEAQREAGSDDATYRNMREPTPPSTDGSAPASAPQRIIYTAAARARVAELDSALARVTVLVANSGGYVASRHRTNNAYQHEAELVIRLPADRLQTALDALPTLSLSIDYQNLDSRNVTEEWLDLETRLRTKRDVRDRYVEILRNRAQRVEDILNAEEKIRVITEEIEAQEGRLRYLRDQVSLSTLTLNLYETQEYRETGDPYTRSFGSRIVSSLAFGWNLIQELILGAVAIWPLVLLGGLGLWIGRRWWRRRRPS